MNSVCLLFNGLHSSSCATILQMKSSLLVLVVFTHVGLPCFGSMRKLTSQDYMGIQSSDRWLLAYLTSWCWSPELLDNLISHLKKRTAREKGYIVPTVPPSLDLDASVVRPSLQQMLFPSTKSKGTSKDKMVVSRHWATELHDEQTAENLGELFSEWKSAPFRDNAQTAAKQQTKLFNTLQIPKHEAIIGNLSSTTRVLLDDHPESSTLMTLPILPNLAVKPTPPPPIIVAPLKPAVSEMSLLKTFVMKKATESTATPKIETIGIKVWPIQTKPVTARSGARVFANSGEHLAQNVTHRHTKTAISYTSKEFGVDNSVVTPYATVASPGETTMVPLIAIMALTTAKPSGPVLISTDMETVIKDCKFWVIFSPGAHKDKNALCHAKLDSLISKYQAYYKFGTVQSGVFSINLYLRDKAKPIEITKDDACDLKVIKSVLEVNKNEKPGEWCMDEEDVSE